MKRVNQPLVDDAELQELYQRAHSAATHYPPRLLEQQQSGDVASHYRGSGMDYEESRLYQAGDEPRFINWRLTARTGEPHIKQFREERRPSVFIWLDHRQSMRFGTRVRLKAAQTTRLAALIAFAAMQQGWAVSGLRVDEQTHWFPLSTDEASIWQFVRECSASCPPRQAQDEPTLLTLLPLLQSQLIRGTHVYLLSDFMDLDEACKSALLPLVQRHPMFAVQVLDPVELALPNAGSVRLQGMGEEAVQTIDLSNAALRKRFAAHAAEKQADTQRYLQGLGYHYTQLLADVAHPETRIPLPHGLGT